MNDDVPARDVEGRTSFYTGKLAQSLNAQLGFRHQSLPKLGNGSGALGGLRQRLGETAAGSRWRFDDCPGPVRAAPSGEPSPNTPLTGSHSERSEFLLTSCFPSPVLFYVLDPPGSPNLAAAPAFSLSLADRQHHCPPLG